MLVYLVALVDVCLSEKNCLTVLINLRGVLCQYAMTHPCYGFNRAHAWLVHDEALAINREKVQRLWR